MFNFRKGISLISLMVVIIVLGILAVVAIPNIKDIADDTRLSATLENKTNVQKAVDRYLLEKQELPVETPGDLKIGEPQQVKWDLLSPDYLREKPADLDKIYYWVDYNGAVWVSNIDSPQNITINTVLGTTTVTWDEVDGAKSYEVGYIDSSLAHQIQTRSLKALNASTGSYKILGVVNSGDTLSYDTTEDLTGKTIVLSSVSENFKSVPVKVGYIGSELEAVEAENVPSGPQPLQTEVPDGWIGVYTVEDLDNMRNNLSGKYILMNSLDLDVAPYNEGEGWEPVGKNSSSSFKGSFDGNGLSISNLTITELFKDYSYLGLFGYVSDGVFTNLKIENINIGNYVSSYDTIGSLAGRVQGDVVIENITSNGSIFTSNGSEIVIGGLVGYIRDSVSVKNSYSSVDIENGYYVGGLVGFSVQSSISNSYSTGVLNVSSPYVGGFIGYSTNSSVSSSFWDVDSSTRASSSGGASKTTPEMYQQSTYTGFDFDTIWSIDEGNDYPRLQWENN